MCTTAAALMLISPNFLLMLSMFKAVAVHFMVLLFSFSFEALLLNTAAAVLFLFSLNFFDLKLNLCAAAVVGLGYRVIE